MSSNIHLKLKIKLYGRYPYFQKQIFIQYVLLINTSENITLIHGTDQH